MKYELKGDQDCPIAQIALKKGEVVKIESGAMAYMQNVELVGKMNSKKKGLGGFLGAIGRSLTSGESMFITEAQGKSDQGMIGVAPAIPGTIHKLTCGKNQYRLNTGAFLASDDTVSYVMKTQSFEKAVFGNTGGFYVMETEGEGDMLINAFGDLMTLTVTPDCPLSVDNEHVVAWDQALDYKIEIASGTFGFMSGEGLMNTFKGSGKVIIQTRNLHSLADAIKPFLPDKSSGN